MKMVVEKSVLEQALEALERLQNAIYNIGGEHVTGLAEANDAADSAEKPMDALRAAVAQQEEPVALDWLHKWANQDDGEPETQWHEGYEAARRVVQIHLTAPPQRQPLPLKTVEMLIYENTKLNPNVADDRELLGYIINTVRAVEQAHRIGDNT